MKDFIADKNALDFIGCVTDVCCEDAMFFCLAEITFFFEIGFFFDDEVSFLVCVFCFINQHSF
jgi:hypothetical protein